MKVGRTGLIMTTVSLALMASPVAHAVGLKDCSLKYKAAKTAGTLNGADWKTFRATQCGATPAAAVTPVASTTAAPASTSTTAPAATAAATPTAPVAKSKAAASGPATFPSAIDPKYAKLSAGKGRMKTCLDQYHANKSSGGNGGLNWIAKGGYYSQCNTKLKGA